MWTCNLWMRFWLLWHQLVQMLQLWHLKIQVKFDYQQSCQIFSSTVRKFLIWFRFSKLSRVTHCTYFLASTCSLVTLAKFTVIRKQVFDPFVKKRCWKNQRLPLWLPLIGSVSKTQVWVMAILIACWQQVSIWNFTLNVGIHFKATVAGLVPTVQNTRHQLAILLKYSRSC